MEQVQTLDEATDSPDVVLEIVRTLFTKHWIRSQSTRFLGINVSHLIRQQAPERQVNIFDFLEDQNTPTAFCAKNERQKRLDQDAHALNEKF